MIILLLLSFEKWLPDKVLVLPVQLVSLGLGLLILLPQVVHLRPSRQDVSLGLLQIEFLLR